jgi:hypothetical protein
MRKVRRTKVITTSMLQLAGRPHVLYKGKKLKTIFLADMVDYFYTKYLFFDKRSVPINSEVLRKKYGMHYNFYRNYLEDTGVLVLDREYSQGNHSKIFRLADEHCDAKRMQLTEIYLPENKANFAGFNVDASIAKSSIDQDIRESLITDLQSVTIDYQSALDWVERWSKTASGMQRIKSLNAINKINESDIYWSFDEYGRMHTNFTVLKRDIRKQFIHIDGEPVEECDIGNSQPMFLYLLMRDSGFTQWQGFDQDVLGNVLYDKVQDQLNINDRSDAKTFVYTVLFGKNYTNDANVAFYKMYPRVWAWICDYKEKANNHKVLSHILQKAESDFIYNKVIRRVRKELPGIKLFTVHDSITCQAKYIVSVSEILREELYNIIPEKYEQYIEY